MLIEILSTITIFLIAYLILKHYITPKNQTQTYKKLFQSKGYRVYKFPYKPFTYPIIQTIYKDSQTQGDAFHTYKNLFSNYDVLIGNQLNNPSISLFHPKLRNQFAKAQRDQVYEKLKSFTKQQARFAGYGLIFSQGEDWKRKRRIMGSLLTHELIKENVADIQEICVKHFQAIQKQTLPTNTNNTKTSETKTIQTIQYNLSNISSNIFSQTILSLFMGLKSSTQKINNQPIAKFILQLANDANMQAKGLLPLIFGIKYLDWGLTRKHREVNYRLRLFNDWVEEFIQGEIRGYEGNGGFWGKGQGQGQSKRKNKNILSIHLQSQLAAAKNNTNTTAPTFQNTHKKQQLIAQLKNFVIAGTDTSVNFFRMAIYYISSNKKIQQKLREQIKQLQKQKQLYNQNQPLTYQSLKKLKYIQAIQKQTTRMFGPTNFNFPRKVLKDHYIDGIPIRRDTIIQYHTICTHYNKQYYQQPHVFKPQRWLINKQKQKKQQQQQDGGQILPLLVGFGLGPRNCIGQHLALIQTKIAIVKFYQRYEDVEICTNNNDKLNFKWKFLYKPDQFNVKVRLRAQKQNKIKQKLKQKNIEN